MCSREGVQRDLLPLIEGTQVSTKHGPVKTDHILFIASGAFHLAKPSDLLPELQGRLPIRVELNALTREDMKRILVEPEASLIKQYVALLKTEEVTLDFAEDAIDALADLATDINSTVENIGARRLADRDGAPAGRGELHRQRAIRQDHPHRRPDGEGQGGPAGEEHGSVEVHPLARDRIGFDAPCSRQGHAKFEGKSLCTYAGRACSLAASTLGLRCGCGDTSRTIRSSPFTFTAPAILGACNTRKPLTKNAFVPLARTKPFSVL